MININEEKLNYFISQNNLLYYINLSIIKHNSIHHIALLKKKRLLENYNLYNNNLKLLKENIHLPFEIVIIFK